MPIIIWGAPCGYCLLVINSSNVELRKKGLHEATSDLQRSYGTLAPFPNWQLKIELCAHPWVPKLDVPGPSLLYVITIESRSSQSWWTLRRTLGGNSKGAGHKTRHICVHHGECISVSLSTWEPDQHLQELHLESAFKFQPRILYQLCTKWRHLCRDKHTNLEPHTSS